MLTTMKNNKIRLYQEHNYKPNLIHYQKSDKFTENNVLHFKHLYQYARIDLTKFNKGT